MVGETTNEQRNARAQLPTLSPLRVVSGSHCLGFGILGEQIAKVIYGAGPAVLLAHYVLQIHH